MARLVVAGQGLCFGVLLLLAWPTLTPAAANCQPAFNSTAILNLGIPSDWEGIGFGWIDYSDDCWIPGPNGYYRQIYEVQHIIPGCSGWTYDFNVELDWQGECDFANTDWGYFAVYYGDYGDHDHALNFGPYLRNANAGYTWTTAHADQHGAMYFNQGFNCGCDGDGYLDWFNHFLVTGGDKVVVGIDTKDEYVNNPYMYTAVSDIDLPITTDHHGIIEGDADFMVADNIELIDVWMSEEQRQVRWSIFEEAIDGGPMDCDIVENADGSATILAGIIPGWVTVRATDFYNPNCYQESLIAVLAPAPELALDDNTLPTDGFSYITAAILCDPDWWGDGVNYWGVEWTAVGETADGSPMNDFLLVDLQDGTAQIHAGTTFGWITVRASSGTDPGSFLEDVIEVVPETIELVLSAPTLRADGKSYVTAELLCPPSWLPLEWAVSDEHGNDLGCQIIPDPLSDTTVDIIAGKEGGTVSVLVQGTSPDSYILDDTLTLEKECDTTCLEGGCEGGGGSANNNSVDVTISLGYVDFGDTGISLRVEENVPGPLATTPAGLHLSRWTPEVILHPPSANPISQVKTPSMLAIVTDITAAGYKVKLYQNSQILNPAGPPPYNIGAATPFATWTIENPVPGNYNSVRVTESQSGKNYVTDYAYLNPGWELVTDGGNRKVRRVRTGNTETYTVLNAANQVKYQEASVYTAFAWAEELTQRTVGTGPNALVTQWFYETTSSSINYRRLIRISMPNGSWETYSYDAAGRKTKTVTQFGDNPLPSTPAQEQQNKVTTFAYDDALGLTDRLEKLKNIEIAHTYEIRTTSGGEDVLRQIRCQNRGVTQTGAAGNLVTETYSYAMGQLNAFKPHRVLNPDGTIRVYSYAPSGSPSGTTRTTTIREGAPNGAKTDVLDGLQTVRVEDKSGNLLSEHVTTISATPLVVSSKTGSNLDPFGRPMLFTYADGTTESVIYGCCGVQSRTDKAGVTTTYDYDNMKRPSYEETAGIAIRTTYDAVSRIESEIRQWMDGTLKTKVLKSYVYDNAGQLVQSSDLTGTTTVTPSVVGTHRVLTTTFPNASSHVQTFANDGNLLEVGGTATYPIKYVYDVDADGQFVTEIKVRGTSETEWVKRYTDLVGRSYKTVYPLDAATTASALATFSPTTGQHIRQENFAEATVLYEYNARGELARTGVDMNANLKIDLDDRVNEAINSYVTFQSKTVRQSDSQVWEPSALTPMTVANPSFETPTVSDNNTSGTITSWTKTGTGGTYNPNNAAYAGTTGNPPPNPPNAGLNVAYLAPGGSIAQSLTAPITPNSKYTLKLIIGKRLAVAFPTTVTVILRTSSGTLLTSKVVPAPANGVFVPVELTHFAFPGDATVGQNLAIAITATGGAGAARADVDKVELFSQVPTKTTTLTEQTTADGRYSWRTSFGQTSSRIQDFVPAQQKLVITETTTDTSSSVTEYVNGRLSTTTSFDGTPSHNQLERVTYTYYPDGLLWQKIDARNGATTFTYNTAESTASITTPAPGFGQAIGQTTLFATDYLSPLGRVETITLPDGSQAVYRYYLTGDLKSSSGTQTLPVEYEYEHGRVTKFKTWRNTTDPTTLQETVLAYHAYRGLVLSRTVAGTLVGSFTYDKTGRLKTRAWNGGATATYTYNLAGEMDTLDHSDTALNPDVRIIRNARGQIATVDDASGSHDYTYYANGNLDEETHRNGILNGIAVKHQFDAANRLQNLILKRSGTAVFTESFAYQDSTSRLKSISSGNYFASYEYEPNSSSVKYVRFRRDGEAGVPVLTTTQVYDALGRLRSIQNTGGPNDLQTVDYDNRSAQRKVTLQDGSYWTYLYDGPGRLQSAKRSWADASLVAGQQFDYQYDHSDNRTATRAGGTGYGINLRDAAYLANAQGRYDSRSVPSYVNVYGSAHSAATVTANDQPSERKGDYFWSEVPVNNSGAAQSLSVTIRGTRWDAASSRDVMATVAKTFLVPPDSQSFGYDGRGNLQNDGVWSYTWDSKNRLLSMERIANIRLLFDYDYLGRRVQKTVQTWVSGAYQTQSTTRFVYDGWSLIAELDGSGNLRSFHLKGSDQGNAGLQMIWDATASQMYFATYDAAGNVANLVKASDVTVAASYEFGPFGEPLRATGPMAAAFSVRYKSQYQDNETGLAYFGYRYYSPSLGRWLSRDPLGEPGGLNLYAFVRNDPVNYSDYLGREMGYWQGVGRTYVAMGRGAGNVGREMVSFVGDLGLGVVTLPILVLPDSWIPQCVCDGLSEHKGSGLTQLAGTEYGGLKVFGSVMASPVLAPVGVVQNGISSVGHALDGNLDKAGEEFGQGLTTAGLLATPFARSNPLIGGYQGVGTWQQAVYNINQTLPRALRPNLSIEIKSAAGKYYQDWATGVLRKQLGRQNVATDVSVQPYANAARTRYGETFKFDAVCRRADGTYTFNEFKASPLAPLTRRQRPGHPLFRQFGGEIRGNQAVGIGLRAEQVIQPATPFVFYNQFTWGQFIVPLMGE